MKRILIVDDEAPLRFLVSEALTGAGYEVIEAVDGAEGFAAYLGQPIDLVITDLVMPNQNGIDLVLQLKQHDPAVKVIAISGGGGITGRFDYLPIAKLVGAASVLNKPFDVRELTDLVKGLLA